MKEKRKVQILYYVQLVISGAAICNAVITHEPVTRIVAVCIAILSGTGIVLARHGK